jgi:cytochrome-b5 reductase
MSDGALSKRYVDGIYIPSALLVVGCVIVKREWAPYAVAVALLLSGYKLWSSSKSSHASADNLRNISEVKTNTVPRSSESAQANGVPEL